MTTALRSHVVVSWRPHQQLAFGVALAALSLLLAVYTLSGDVTATWREQGDGVGEQPQEQQQSMATMSKTGHPYFSCCKLRPRRKCNHSKPHLLQVETRRKSQLLEWGKAPPLVRANARSNTAKHGGASNADSAHAIRMPPLPGPSGARHCRCSPHALNPTNEVGGRGGDSCSSLELSSSTNASTNATNATLSDVVACKHTNWTRKYMMAVCTSGQMSNRAICWRNYLVYAALLNRTLILPRHDLAFPGYNYTLEAVVDFHHLKTCLGDASVVTPAEMMAAEGVDAISVRMVCLGNCTEQQLRAGLATTAPYMRIKNGRFLQAKYVKAGGRSNVVSAVAVLRAYGARGSLADEPVISIGEAFTSPHMREFPPDILGGPFAHKAPDCMNLLQPHPAVFSSADLFVNQSLGEGFVAIHFRRGDFEELCAVKKCWYPLPTIVRCAVQRLIAARAFLGSNLTVYVASNARREELEELEDGIANGVKLHFGPVKFVHIPSFEWPPLKTKSNGSSSAGGEVDNDSDGDVSVASDETEPSRGQAPPWLEVLGRFQKWNTLPEVQAAFEKIVCARARMFLGSFFSTFSADIFRIRASTGKSFCVDDYLCGGLTAGNSPLSKKTQTESL